MKKQIQEFVYANLDGIIENELEYSTYCPFHKNTNTQSFSVNKRTGLFFCFNPSCNAKGNFKSLRSRLGGLEGTLEPSPTEQEITESLVWIDPEPEKWHEVLDRLTDNLEYLLDRGFELEKLREFEVGFSEKQNRIVIPMRDKDFNLVGLIGRAIDSETMPKYKYSFRFPRGSNLFNLCRAKQFKEVIVCEGSLDAIRIASSGYQNVVATLGSRVGVNQIKLLNRYFESIIIMSDDDDAGEKMKDIILKGCCSKQLFVVEYIEGLHDPGEMNKLQIKQILESKIDYLTKEIV